MLQAGCANVDITPPLTIPYLGFVPRQAYFQGVHDTLQARAVVLDDGDTRAALISAEAIGFDNRILGPGRSFTAEVRERVETWTGIPASHVMLACTHAHSTPETINFRRLADHPGATAWLEVLRDQLATSVALASRSLSPVTLAVGSEKLTGLSVQRRASVISGYRQARGLPDGPETLVDEELLVAVLSGAGPAGRIVLSNFATHPVIVQVNPLVSADFPGAAMRFVEHGLPDCRGSLFLQGADGDINPTRPNADFAEVRRVGTALGAAVVSVAARSTEPEGQRDLRVSVASETIALPSCALPDEGTVREAWEEADRKAAEAGTEAERNQWLGKRRMIEEQLVRLSWGDEPIPAEIQAMRVGDLALVGLPGEAFCEIGLQIKARSPAAYTAIVGYANDYQGYFPTDEAFEQGGYEVSTGPWARVGPGSEAMIVEAAVRLLEGLC